MSIGALLCFLRHPPKGRIFYFPNARHFENRIGHSYTALSVSSVAVKKRKIVSNVNVSEVLESPSGDSKSIWWMPRLSQAKKDAAKRRYAPGRCQATFDPEISEWGNPTGFASCPER